MGKKYTKLVDYAAHRGITPAAVTKAIRSGRLHGTLVRDAKGVAQIRDVAAADREWEANTRHRVASVAMSPEAYELRAWHEESRARKETAFAELAEIELAERRAAFVSVGELEASVTRIFAHCTNRLLRVPADLAARCPQLTPEQVEMFAGLIRECLEEINPKAAEQLVESLQARA